jgi:hypothetical protein
VVSTSRGVNTRRDTAVGLLLILVIFGSGFLLRGCL